MARSKAKSAASSKGPAASDPTEPATDQRYDVRMDGVYFFRSMPATPFHLALEGGDYSYCFMVRRGTMTLNIEFPVSQNFDLGPGDIVGLSGLTSHAFRSPGCDASFPTGLFEKQPLARVDAQPGDVDLLIGVVPQETLALSNMVIGPIYLGRSRSPEYADRIWKAAELLEDEFQDSGETYNQSIIVRRIAEIILINMTRSILTQSSGDTFSVPPMPAGMNVLRALQEFLRMPEKDWTVEALARIAGMSRTKFSDEFRRVTGKTPIQTITRIRLTMTARRLLTERLSIEEAADLAGYSSAAAFVRAFQREFGLTPAKWRRQQLS